MIPVDVRNPKARRSPLLDDGAEIQFNDYSAAGWMGIDQTSGHVRCGILVAPEENVSNAVLPFDMAWPESPDAGKKNHLSVRWLIPSYVGNTTERPHVYVRSPVLVLTRIAGKGFLDIDPDETLFRKS